MMIFPVLSTLEMKWAPIVNAEHTLSDSTSSPTWNYTTNVQMTKATISDDGNVILVVEDKQLHLLDPSSNASIWTFSASEQIFSVSTCENGSLTAIGTVLGDGFVILLGQSSNESLWVYNATNWIIDVSISGDGSTIAAVDWEGWTYLFDYRSNETLWKYKSPEPMLSVAISYDGNTIISGGKNNTVYAFDRTSNGTLWTYEMDGWVYGLGLNENGSRIVSASPTNVCTFNRTSNSTVWEYSGNDFITSEISKDGSTVAVGTSSTVYPLNLYVFGFSSNDTIWTFNGTNQIREIDMTYDGSHILVGSYDANTYLFSRDSNEPKLQYTLSGLVWQVSITSNGNRFVIGAENGAIFYNVERPTVSVSQYAGLLGTSDLLTIQANITKGTFSISSAVLYYRHGSDDWSNVTMSNTTLLTITQVMFEAIIGPFEDGVVEYYASVSDALSILSDSVANEARIDGNAPEKHSIGQNPLHPTSDDAVVITANITDLIGAVDRVFLNYTIDTGLNWNAIEMLPNVIGIYEGAIPEQANGTTIQYYLYANDTVGNIAEFLSSGFYFEYTVFDPISTTSTTTTTTPIDTNTSTSQPPPDDGAFGLILAVGGIIGILLIGILYILRRRFAEGDAAPKVAVPTSGDSTGSDGI